MKEKINLKILIIVILVIIVGTVLYFWYNIGEKPEGIIDPNEIPTEPKKYDVNEYINLSISDQNMAVKYLNDYFYIVFQDTEKAYYLLDEDYRTTRFGNLQNFITYVEQNYSTFPRVAKYYVSGNIYYIYDESDNLFVFSTKGVMQYKVYLDDETVEVTPYK